MKSDDLVTYHSGVHEYDVACPACIRPNPYRPRFVHPSLGVANVAEPVPEWVHMADTPPPADAEPVLPRHLPRPALAPSEDSFDWRPSALPAVVAGACSGFVVGCLFAVLLTRVVWP